MAPAPRLCLVLPVLLAHAVPRALGGGAVKLRHAGSGHHDTVQSPSPEAREEDEATALIRAAADGDKDRVKLLLDGRSDTEARDDDSCTALMRAAGHGQRSTVELLLDHRAHLEARSGGGSTPLVWAASGGHSDTAEVLLDRRADMEAPDYGGRSALMWAARTGHKLTTKLLLDRRADMEAQDKDGWNALIWAADRGQESTVELLLDSRADMEARDKQGSTPLIKAAFQGHQNATKLLLDRRADPEAQDKHGWTALMRATEDDHPGTRDVQHLLLGRGADLTHTKDGAALIMAAGNGHEAKVKQLLDEGVELETRDKDGKTPLIWAALEGHVGTTKLLLNRRADLEACDKDGKTPLIWAALEGHVGTTKLLLNRRADLEARDKDGKTPLIWAAGSGKTDIVRELYKSGADPAIGDPAGLTAADFALSRGQFHVLAAVPELLVPYRQRYHRLLTGWNLHVGPVPIPKFWLVLAASAVVIFFIVSLSDSFRKRGKTGPLLRMKTVHMEGGGPNRGATQLAVKTLFSKRWQWAAMAFRAAEVFVNLFMPMRLMLIVRPEICLPVYALAYVATNWYLTGKAPWSEPCVLMLVSARQSLFGHPGYWKPGTVGIYFVGIVRGLLLLASIHYFASQCGAEDPPWYCNAKGREVTDLLLHNSQQTLCIPGVNPVPPQWRKWRMSGACELDQNDSKACITSPNWPEEYGPNSECTVTVPRFSSLYTEDFHTEHYFDQLTVNGEEYSGEHGPHEVFAGGFPGGLVWGCFADPPNITFKADQRKFGAWKLCRRPELCVPMLPVNNVWQMLDKFGLAVLSAWLVAMISVPCLWTERCSFCCPHRFRSATRREVRELAVDLDMRRCGHPMVLDQRVQLITRRGLYFTVSLLVLDLFLDTWVVNMLLLHLDFMFAFCMLTAVAGSTAVEIVNGDIQKLRQDIRDIVEKGVPTDHYLRFLDQERGTKALVSLLVTLYAVPFAIRQSLQMCLTMLSVTTSLCGIINLLHERIDLLGVVTEGEDELTEGEDELTEGEDEPDQEEKGQG